VVQRAKGHRVGNVVRTVESPPSDVGGVDPHCLSQQLTVETANCAPVLVGEQDKFSERRVPAPPLSFDRHGELCCLEGLQGNASGVEHVLVESCREVRVEEGPDSGEEEPGVVPQRVSEAGCQFADSTGAQRAEVWPGAPRARWRANNP
jgi:hypothetical protein